MNTQPIPGHRLSLQITGVASAGAAESLQRRPKHRRLRLDRDVRAVFEHGRPSHTRCLSVYAMPSDGPTRTTVVASKKIGGAVRRNRAKRRLRAALQSARLPEGYDVVVVARSRCLAMPFTDLRTQLTEQVRRSVKGCGAA